MISCIIDTSVVLAIVLAEPGCDLAAEIMPKSMISSVNLAEIVTKLIGNGYDPVQVEIKLAQLELVVSPFDQTLAITTGLLRRTTRHKGLSLGDRACLALALREKLPVYTTDRAWAELDIGVEVRLLR